MRRHLVRGLAIAAIVGVALVVIGGGAAWWVIGTETGTRWGVERLGALAPGAIHVKLVRGPLRGPLTIFGLHYQTPELDLTVDRVSIDWRLGALALRQLDVRRLDADGVHVKLIAPAQAAATPDTTPLPDIDFPVRITVREAHVRHAEITPAGKGSALAIDAVDLDDGAFRDTLHIGRLSVRSARFDVEVAGHARTHGGYTADLTTRWVVRAPGVPELRGHGRFVGDLDTLRVTQDVDTPSAHLDALAFRVLRDPRFAATLDVHGFGARAWNPAWPAGRSDAHVVAAGTPDAFEARGTLDATTADWGRVNAVYAIARDLKQIRIDTLTVTQPGAPGQLDAAGRLGTTGKTLTLDLHGGWRELGWPLTGARQVESPRGAFDVGGTLDAYRLAMRADIGTPQIPASPWTLAADGTPQSLAVRSLRGTVLGGGVDARGDVRWASGVDWRLAVTGRGLDPGATWPGWSGDLGFAARSQGRMTAAGPVGDAEIDSLTGTLRQRPVSGAARATFAPDRVTIPSAVVAWGADSVTVSGPAAATYDLSWSVVGRDLSEVVPSGSGTFVARGQVLGPRRTPRLRADVRGDSIVWANGRLASLAGAVDVSMAEADSSRVDLDAAGIMAGTQVIDHLALTGRGTRGDHQVRIDATAEQDSVRLEARGGLAGDTWRGALTTLDLVTNAVGDWSLVQHAPITVSARAASIADFCWGSGASRLCGKGDWSAASGWSADATLRDVNLATFRPLLPDGLQMTASVNGSLAAHGEGSRVAGAARLDVGAGDIAYAEAGKTAHVALRGAALIADAGPNGLDARASIDFGAADSIGAVGRFPQFGSAVATPSQTIHGELRASIVDLGVVQGVVPQLARTRGAVTANLAVDGTAGNPRWRGEARLVNGQADVPLLGLHLTDGTFDARSETNGQLTFDAGARSGQGDVRLAGTGTIAADGTPRANATLKGNRLLVSQRQDLRAVVSPDLTLSLVKDSLRVRGDITVAQADVQMRKPKPGAISPSEDIVYVDSTTRVAPPKPKAQLATSAAVRLVLGDSVRVRGFGLDAKPTGSVLALLRSDGTANGSGQLTVTNGSYQAYGQRYTIETGSLLFAGGPLANPGLNVKADRTANDGTVAGFNVTGTLAAPQLTVFSVPVMDDRDALSYALIGRPVSSSSRAEQGIVSDAANSLSLSGGSYVASKLASQFGLSEASLEGGGTIGGTSLNLGTYVSPRVYVTYGLSILDPVQRLRIQYFLSRMWTLQAETGAQNSADILYTVEH